MHFPALVEAIENATVDLTHWGLGFFGVFVLIFWQPARGLQPSLPGI